PRASAIPLLHLLRRPAPWMAYLSVEVVARGGHRTPCGGADRFPHGRCSGQSAAAADRIFRAERRFTRSRYADRLRRHEWSSGHPLEALVPSEGERMSRPMIIEGTIPLRRHRRTAGPDGHNSGSLATNSLPLSRIPRIARLMALARHVDDSVRAGTVCSYAAA